MTDDTRLRFWHASWQPSSPPTRAGSPPDITPHSTPVRRSDAFYPPATPTPRERRVYDLAVQQAKALGLALPPGRVVVRFFQRSREGDECYGTCHHREAPIAVWLSSSLSDGQLFLTAVHELRHAHDVLTLGLERYIAQSREEHEHRAESFAHAAWAQFCLARGQWALIGYPELWSCA